MGAVDTTIRNLDEVLYRRLKARAALEGATVGEAMNEAMRRYLGPGGDVGGSISLGDLEPVSYGEDAARLSEEIDEIVFGGSGNDAA